MGDNTNISLIDCGVNSLKKLNSVDLKTARSLNLHHNLIKRIEGLSCAKNLRYVDLSSNLISEICGLECLHSLRTLNLSSNRIKNVQNLKSLKSLVHLDLSFNAIENLEGLKELHGKEYRLTVIHLQGNNLASLERLLSCTSGLVHLKQLTVYDSQIERNNPVCKVPNYRRTILDGLPQLNILDNLDSNDKPVRLDVLADLPELSNFLDYVSSSSLSEANEAQRQMQEACIQNTQSHTKTPRTTTKEQPDPTNDSQSEHVDPGESTNNHPQCSLSPLTERRLINLENQLSSLVAMQLMRLNEPAAARDPSAPAESDFYPQKREAFVDDTDEPADLDIPPGRKHSRPIVEVADGRHSRLKSRSNTNETLNKKLTGENLTAYSTRKSDEPGTANISYTARTSQSPGHEPGMYRNSAQSGEDHPPGAPKRPNASSVGKALKATNQHPAHGKPIFPRRPSSTPGASIDMTRTLVSASTSSESPFQKVSSRRTSGGMRRGDVQDSSRNTGKSGVVLDSNDVQTKTLGQVLKELDAERLQRKQSEQLCRELTERVLHLEASAVDEGKALEATQKLKQAFTAERRARLAAESQLRELDARLSEVFSAVDTMRVREAAEKSRVNEETNKMSIRLVELAKDYQDAIGRAERAEKKLDDVQCALKTKELEFKELQESRFTIDSPEVAQLIAARVELVEARHLQTIKAQQEKLEEGSKRFTALEDEFRLALRIEAERYNELFNSSEALKSRLAELETTNKDLQQREESARQLVTELTNTIKEQKAKTTSQQKSSLLIQHNQKERIATLEAHLEEARTRLTNLETLKNEQKQLKAELAAQESLVMGLRAERRNWSEELAKQSSALAQDRGRLESKIEAQALEISSLKKSLEEEADAVKIKTKIIDDQADSIRNLKKALTDNQNEMKNIQNEALQLHQKLDEQIAQLKREKEDSAEKIQRLMLRKEELKDTVADLEAKNEELRSQNDTLSHRWHDRTSLLDKLEKQVEQMRHGWEEEQKLLISERDEAKNRVAALQAQMERMDASFRKQLAATIEANDRALSAARSDAELIRSNCESRVAEVEAEMRVVLEETEEARQAMETRLRKLSSVLYDPAPSEVSLPPSRTGHHGHHLHSFPHTTEWSITPPPPASAPAASSSNARISQPRLVSSPTSGPCVHSCGRLTHPSSPFERELGAGCESGTCVSPH